MTGPQPAPALRIRIAGGATVVVPGRIDLLTPYVLLEQEDWFEDELRFLRSALMPGMRVVDIGANYGLYALSLALTVGPSGRVWAVEPASATAVYLQQGIDANSFAHVTLVRKALSDREGTARLSVEANSELNSLGQGSGTGATEEVPLTTLDVLTAEAGWDRIDFLKLDAEGEEERIVAGGCVFLRSQSPLILFEIRHGERLILGLAGRLAALGYATYRLLPGPGLLVPWDPAAPLDDFQLNLFACKPDRAASLERAGKLQAAPSGRYAAMQAAYATVKAACGNDPARLAACARLARDLGERRQAIELLNRALAQAPAPQVLAGVLEDLVTLAAFSTYFGRGAPLGGTFMRQLEALRATGFIRPPMERRSQLMRILAGLQAGPEPDPLLTTAAPDHLNPGLWGG